MATNFAYEVYVLMDSYVSYSVGKQAQETFKHLQTSLTPQQLTQLIEGIITPLAKEAQAKYLRGETSGYKQGQFEAQLRYCNGVNRAINKDHDAKIYDKGFRVGHKIGWENAVAAYDIDEDKKG